MSETDLAQSNLPPTDSSAQLEQATDSPVFIDSTDSQDAAGVSEVDLVGIQGDPREDADGKPPSPISEKGHEQLDEDSDDADAWNEISKGRYFGLAEEDNGPLCHNCKQPGHKKKDCPHQLCRSCGALDDHDTMRCPMTQRCYNCSRLGHVASKCPEPQRQQGSYCTDCGSKSHLERTCPQIWRFYHLASSFKPDGPWDVTAYCYNCAAKGHYGDDCSKPHRARLIESSAFCIANQPESKHEKLKRERNEDRESSRRKQLDEDDREEDWFARQRGQTHFGDVDYEDYQNRNRGHDYRRRSPPISHASRRPRHENRYNPYARPAKPPIIISDRFPRGRSNGQGSNGPHRSSLDSRAQPKHQYDKHKAPTAPRNINPKRGKSYRGGGRH